MMMLIKWQVIACTEAIMVVEEEFMIIIK